MKIKQITIIVTLIFIHMNATLYSQYSNGNLTGFELGDALYRTGGV